MPEASVVGLEVLLSVTVPSGLVSVVVVEPSGLVSVEVVGWEGVEVEEEPPPPPEEPLSLGVEGIAFHLAYRVIFSVTRVLKSYAMVRVPSVYQPPKV